MNPINSKLKRLAQSSDEAKRLFEFFADKNRNDNSTTIGRFRFFANRKELHPVLRKMDAQSVRPLFLELEGLGIGSIVDAGKPSEKFNWKFQIRSVGEVGLGQREDILPLVSSTTHPHPKLQSAPQKNSRVHEFQLRDNFKAQIILPVDLTQKEADRLATLISILPTEKK